MIPSRRSIAIGAFVLVLGGLASHAALAHGGLQTASPVAGAMLGDTPAAVQLTFSERPEPQLSTIRVLDTRGTPHQIGRPEIVQGDPLSLSVRVRPLDQGVYTVSWRVVSAVDGHATAGTYAFGVRQSPEGTGTTTPSYPAPSPLEMLARWLFMVGLVVVLGAASAAVAQFGGSREFPLAAAGWIISLAGVVLLGYAQRSNAAASFADMVNTSVGRALIGRSVLIAAAGAALLTARLTAPRFYRAAMAGAAIAAMGSMAVHVSAGHAGAGRWPLPATVGAQWAHFAASGIWIGGLAALLLGIRGTPSSEKTVRVRRFSTIAAFALVVIAMTGAIRAIHELSSWRELTSTGYGRFVLVKGALFVLIAALGAINRWRSVSVAALDLRPLRRASGGELALMAGAIAAAAVLGTLPPPAAAISAPVGLVASGVDFGTSVRVRLTTASPQPGPNRFVLHAVDYDSKAPVRADRVTLRFTPVDDPGIASTSLALTRAQDDSYVGSGANLAFDGRWRVAVIVQRAGTSIEIPLELETRSSPQPVSVERPPGKAVKYTVEVKGAGSVRFSPDPDRAGPSKLFVTCFDVVQDFRPIADIVVTISTKGGPARVLSMQRIDRATFVADVDLEPGRNRLTAVAHAANGLRVRAAVEIDISGGKRWFRFW